MSGHETQSHRRTDGSKRRAVADASSALNRAAPEEPVFVLRAHDPCAGATVRQWARIAYQTRTHEADKIEQALEIADQMDNWRVARMRERAGMP